MTAVHFSLGDGKVRCNRQGMRSHMRPTVGLLRASTNPAAVTCQDCARLVALDASKAEATA